MTDVWAPDVYVRFRDERRRPVTDLLSRIDGHLAAATVPRAITSVVDLGCGTGDITLDLARRWPSARVVGIDSSASMVETAKAAAAAAGGDIAARVSFEQGSIEEWPASPDDKYDVVFSSAALHWVEKQLPTLQRWAGAVSPGGVLAMQVPSNFTAPSHTSVWAVAALPAYAALVGAERPAHAESLEAYAGAAAAAGLAPIDAWETRYLHLLGGDDAVFRWLEGTTLRPVLARLRAAGGGVAEGYAAELRQRLAAEYPRSAALGATPFVFARRFLVALRR